MTVHSGSQEMVEDCGEIFQQCMSLCLGGMGMIRYPNFPLLFLSIIVIQTFKI